jgi:hypothetical protein
MTFHKGLHIHRILELLQRAPQGKGPICGVFVEPSDGLEPSTPSLPWRFWGVTRVHARSLATHFLLLIGLLRRSRCVARRRACRF